MVEEDTTLKFMQWRLDELDSQLEAWFTPKIRKRKMPQWGGLAREKEKVPVDSIKNQNLKRYIMIKAAFQFFDEYNLDDYRGKRGKKTKYPTKLIQELYKRSFKRWEKDPLNPDHKIPKKPVIDKQVHYTTALEFRKTMELSELLDERFWLKQILQTTKNDLVLFCLRCYPDPTTALEEMCREVQVYKLKERLKRLNAKMPRQDYERKHGHR